MLALLAMFIPSVVLGGLTVAAWRLSRAYQGQYTEDCLAGDMEPVVRAPVVATAPVRKRRARKSGLHLKGSLTGLAAA